MLHMTLRNMTGSEFGSGNLDNCSIKRSGVGAGAKVSGHDGDLSGVGSPVVDDDSRRWCRQVDRKKERKVGSPVVDDVSQRWCHQVDRKKERKVGKLYVWVTCLYDLV
ncbi:hypothetical protein NDU88_002629 [Pleurodeles waltl]|uniref:Uncharacterized protein n=1 Tax=Pleurodeles waltl TaxID=8319 RepID=A0AAV7TMH6_PLEWA|nr:hypothetical protein NDU88_002629 [Pleurodeles waltl]